MLVLDATRTTDNSRAPAPAVALRSAVCVLGRFPVLAGVDLEIAPGQVVLVSGANGAGKSTLLRVIAGLVPLLEGTARVLGTDLARDRQSHRRQLALVGHESGCYDDLTVRANLRFWARASGRPAETADAALERLGLAPVADVDHGRLSAGQRRRCTLAVALCREPALFLFDEPHGGLDAEARDIVDRLIADSPAQGRTIVIASHELTQVRALCDREVVLAGGRLTESLVLKGTDL